MVCVVLLTPGTVTVTAPLAPEMVETWNVPVPTPEPGLTVMLVWSDVAVQAADGTVGIVTRTVCGLVINEPLIPKFSTFRFTTSNDCVEVTTVESATAAEAEPPPETEAVFTSGEVAEPETLTVTVTAGKLAPAGNASARVQVAVLHVQPVPDMAVTVNPDGGVSVIVTSPAAAPRPALRTEIVY